MQTACLNPYRGINWKIIGYLTISALLILCSCGSRTSVPMIENANGSKPKESRHIVFKGNDYIVCELRGNETSNSLAKIFLGDRKKGWIIEDANDNHVQFENGQVVIIPLKQQNIGGITAKGYQTVPVLAYYLIKNKCDASPCLPADVFDQQMGYLKNAGYRIISMADLFDFLYYKRAIPHRSIIITFDSSDISTYTISYPILKKYGFIATLFINADSINVEKTTLTWPQIKELRMNGFEIGSLGFLNGGFTGMRQGEDEQSFMTRMKTSLLHSKKIIDRELSQDTRYVAFPSDQYNPFLLNICDQIGYKIAFSMQQGSNPFFSDPLALKRYPILDRDLQTFITKLKTFQKAPLR